MRIAIKDKNKVCVVRSDGKCWNDTQSTVHQLGALHVYLVCMIGGGLVNTGLSLGGQGLALGLRQLPCGEKHQKNAVNPDTGFAIDCNAITRFYKIGIGSWAAVSKHNTQCILVIGSLLLTIVMVTVI